MTWNDFKRLIAPIQRKIFLLLGRALLTAVNNSEGTQKIQITVLNNETITDVERMQEYGFETYPFTGAEVMTLFLNGNRDHGIAVCVHDRRYRPKDLVEGEVCVYTDEDKTDPYRMHLKRSRILFVVADKFDFDADTEATLVSPKIMLGDDVWANVRKLIDVRFQALFNGHVHSGVQAGGSNTGVPTELLTDAHMTDQTRAV